MVENFFVCVCLTSFCSSFSHSHLIHFYDSFRFAEHWTEGKDFACAFCLLNISVYIYHGLSIFLLLKDTVVASTFGIYMLLHRHIQVQTHIHQNPHFLKNNNIDTIHITDGKTGVKHAVFFPIICNHWISE